MWNRVSYFIILFIILTFVLLELLDIGVSDDLFLFFYIFIYLSSQDIIYHCRSPPINTSYEIRVDWRFFYV